MRPSRDFTAFGLIAAACTPLSAQQSPLAGRWCAPTGEVLYLEPGSIGFNAHTICEWDGTLPREGALKAELACANIYMNGDVEVRAFERNITLSAEPEGKEGLRVQIDEEQPALWRRCDI